MWEATAGSLARPVHYPDNAGDGFVSSGSCRPGHTDRVVERRSEERSFYVPGTIRTSAFARYGDTYKLGRAMSAAPRPLRSARR
jgi:hypothetical protein